MRTSAVVVALAAFVGQAFAQALINTPASLLTCQPALLSWSGGAPPYYLSILPGGQSGGAPLKQFGEQSGTSLTWNVDLAAGTSITLAVRDSTGAVNYSDQVSITAGNDASCVSGDVDASGAGGEVAVTSSATAAVESAQSSAAAATSGLTSGSAANSAISSAESAASSVASSVTSAASSVRSSLTDAASRASSAGASASSASASATPDSGASTLVASTGALFAGIVAFALA